MLWEESEEFIVASKCPIKIGMTPSHDGDVKGLCYKETDELRHQIVQTRDCLDTSQDEGDVVKMQGIIRWHNARNRWNVDQPL